MEPEPSTGLSGFKDWTLPEPPLVSIFRRPCGVLTCVCGALTRVCAALKCVCGALMCVCAALTCVCGALECVRATKARSCDASKFLENDVRVPWTWHLSGLAFVSRVYSTKKKKKVGKRRLPAVDIHTYEHALYFDLFPRS